MKRPWLILLGGVAAGLLAYGGSYLVSSAPYARMAKSQKPELAWLQTEFHIADSEFARIATLHESYLNACADRCRRIDAKNDELKSLLAATNRVTPEIEKAVQDTARLRADCQQAMLQHFYEVSQTMPPEQGRRYLSWMIARTLGPAHSTMTSNLDGHADHEHHPE